MSIKKSLTYKVAGVNRDTENETKAGMASALKSSDSRVLNTIGAFASLYDGAFPEYEHPVLVLKTEEPGTKQLLAFKYDKVEGVCHDLVNHLVNDAIVMGAKPLSIQDCIVCGKVEKSVVLRMVNAFAEAAKNNGCALTGGETSWQPGVIPEGTYILSASIVGVVDKKNIIDGSKIQEGDVVQGHGSFAGDRKRNCRRHVVHRFSDDAASRVLFGTKESLWKERPLGSRTYHGWWYAGKFEPHTTERPQRTY